VIDAADVFAEKAEPDKLRPDEDEENGGDD